MTASRFFHYYWSWVSLMRRVEHFLAMFFIHVTVLVAQFVSLPPFAFPSTYLYCYTRSPTQSNTIGVPLPWSEKCQKSYNGLVASFQLSNFARYRGDTMFPALS